MAREHENMVGIHDRRTRRRSGGQFNISTVRAADEHLKLFFYKGELRQVSCRVRDNLLRVERLDQGWRRGRMLRVSECFAKKK